MTKMLRGWKTVLACVAMTLVLAGCGEKDPGALGPEGINGLSSEARKQDYIDGVQRALGQLSQASGPDFGRAIEAGNTRQLQTQALAWDQGVSTLQQLDPPKDAIPAHKRLVAATAGLGEWNQKLVRAAPNKTAVRGIAKQASTSPESNAYGQAICDLIGLGYDISDEAANACGPLDEPGSIGGDDVMEG